MEVLQALACAPRIGLRPPVELFRAESLHRMLCAPVGCRQRGSQALRPGWTRRIGRRRHNARISSSERVLPDTHVGTRSGYGTDFHSTRRISSLFYCFFCSTVVDFCVVELSVAGFTDPSGLTVAGVVCLVSLCVVVLSLLVVCGVGVSPGTTTVVGAGVCWQPASIPPITTTNPGR